MTSLRDKTVSGIFWSFLQTIGSKGISLMTTIILARILSPRDFGLIGMLTIFIAISQTLVQAGFRQALIQKQGADEEDYSSVFYINLLASLILYGILFFTAPLIANFYEQPVLVDITRILALVFVINAFSYVQEARLSKEMRFKTLMVIHLPSTIISGIVAVAMALVGYGVWSIVAQQLVMRFAYAVQIWLYLKWRPLWHFNKLKAKKLFSFGSNLMIAGIIQTVFDNIYLIIIGKFFSIDTLGYYQNAKKLVDVPTRTISTVLRSVTFTVFSSVQDDHRRLSIGYKKSTQQLVFFLAPIVIFAAVLAKPLFSFVLTDKWLPAVPFFQILCLVGIFSPLNANSLNIINAKGRSDIVLKLQIIKKVIVALSIAITIPMGIWPLIISQFFNIVFSFFINIFYIHKLTNYSIKEQLTDVYPAILISLVMGAIILFIDSKIHYLYDWMRILIGTSIGIGGYILISWRMAFSSLKELIEIVHVRYKPIKRV